MFRIAVNESIEMVDFDYSPAPASGEDYEPGHPGTSGPPLGDAAPASPPVSTEQIDQDPETEVLIDPPEAELSAGPLLSFEEGRVLGCLMEKARTTPDSYPLSLNLLTTACNQKTSRLPVTDLDEEEVMDAVEGLREKRLVHRVDQAGARTVKFQHRAADTLELQSDEAALLCVLFLRGPQTSGELRTRTERLHRFDSPAEVEEVLRDLMARSEPLIQVIPAGSGRKEVRYHQILCEYPFEIPETSTSVPVYQALSKASAEQVEALEARVADLEAKLAALNEDFGQIRELLD